MIFGFRALMFLFFSSRVLSPFDISHRKLVCFDFGPEENMSCVAFVDDDSWCRSWTNSAMEVQCIGYDDDPRCQ